LSILGVILAPVQLLVNALHIAGLACYTDQHSSILRMRKKSASTKKAEAQAKVEIKMV